MLKPATPYLFLAARQFLVNILCEKPIVGIDSILVLARRWETSFDSLPTRQLNKKRPFPPIM
jgi:hypothetical protein